MALLLPDCTFFGPALPEPFVKFELERLLRAKDLLPEPRGEAGRRLDDQWETYRRKLRALGEQGGERRVVGHVLEPLGTALGYGEPSRAEDVATREGAEDGGWLFSGPEGASLRAWAVSVGTDLDAPARRHVAPRQGRPSSQLDDEIYQRIATLLTERGVITSGDAQQLTGLDAAGVRPYLTRLVDDGRAVMEGERRGTRYRRVP